MIRFGTGHRPDKLGGYPLYWRINHDRLVDVTGRYLAREGADEVISGGALGFDQALASAAWIEGIPFRMYLPFEDFDCKWPDGSRRVLSSLCEKAAVVKFICEPGYAPWKMQKRNEAMADDGDECLALWNGTFGGTHNCIRYVQSIEKPIYNLWEEYCDALR